MKRDEEKKKPPLGSVGKIQQQLYAKTNRIKEYSRRGFSEHDQEDVSTNWSANKKSSQEGLLEKRTSRKEPMTVFGKLLILSMVFFIFSVGGAFMVFQYGQNEVSYDIVRLTVLGPNSVAGGEEINFDVNVINDNPVDIILTDVAVNYPKGTITADAEGLPLPKDIVSIESVRSGLQESAKFKAILFGKEGDTKDMNIVFQYRVPGSDNIFFKERTYTVQIESAPVVINASHENSYLTGSEVEVVIDVASNAAKRVRNLLLVVDYPFGFEFASSTPVAFDGDSVFDIGDLRPGESQQIVIKGNISGQDDEKRTFRYTLGAQSVERKNEIGSTFTFTESDMSIQRPPVKLELALDENTKLLQVVDSGESMKFSLGYQNNLNSKIIDAKIEIKLAGQAYNRRAVFSPEGYYRSSTDSITWTRSENPKLGEIEIGQKGEVEFEIDMQTAEEMAGLLQNPELVLTATLSGTNFEDGGTERKVSGSTIKRIKVNSDLALNNRALYSVGPITNLGPMQPTVGEITTYTGHWRLSNSTNELKDVVVKAVIPRYISFRNVIVPENSSISFNERTREIIWQAGNIQPGAGFTAPVKEVYFGLSFEPSLDQLRSTPVLMEKPTITATDSFTEERIIDEGTLLTSRLEQDPDYNPSAVDVIE